ncbi:MAG: pyruvate kinase [Polyangiaceae bacterium]|nr:pyruvate kinase [Polyangiaceae bacterium]
MNVNAATPPLKYRRTKIVATLGPASSSPAIIEGLITAGVNVFRLNMSHGDHAGHRVSYEAVRTVAARLDAHVAVLADLCGPKIRVGTFPGGRIELTTGDAVTVTSRAVEGNERLIPSQYEALPSDVRVGDRILLDDGNLELRVEGKEGTEIACRVVTGGTLKDKKGMNLPGVAVSAPALTAKDREDARFAAELGVDFIALSFVRWAKDVGELRDLLRATGREVPIVSKIEKPEALENIEAIVDASDAIMVARGDLGVELPPEAVPNVQEELVDLARARRRPVIVATQMLESMIEHPRPTRAEVTDVANAVRSGADAVMLSGETAAGHFPVEAVHMMDLIARQTESYLYFHGGFGSIEAYTPTAPKPAPPIPVEAAVANAAALLSRELLVRGIVVLHGGLTLAVMAAARPAAPIVALASRPADHAAACLTWGAIPVHCMGENVDCPAQDVPRLVRALALAAPGDPVLVVRGFHPEPGVQLPSITVVTVSESEETAR